MSHPHLDDPTLHDALRAMVRRRVPPSDVDDVVQSTLADAVAAPAPPRDREQLRRWVFGIARHKIVDAHRSRRHEPLDDHEGGAALASDAAEASEASDASALLRWAERELPHGAEARSTLGLMLREGDGERLEHLAADARLPAATVRQRVHRMRAHFRARWALQVAVVLALALGGLGLYLLLGERHEMALHPIVGGAPSQSIGGSSPSPSSTPPKSEATTPLEPAPSTSAAPKTPATIKPPPDAPASKQKMLAPEPQQLDAPKAKAAPPPPMDRKPSKPPVTEALPNASDDGGDGATQRAPLPKEPSTQLTKKPPTK